MTLTIAAIAAALALVVPGSAALVESDFALRDKVVAQLGPLQEELANLFPATFGGLWVNSLGETTVAVVGETSGIAKVVADANVVGPVSYRAVNFSAAEIRAAHIELRGRVNLDDFSLNGLKLASIAEDLVNNAVVVSVVDGGPIDLADLQAQFGLVVKFRAVDQASQPVSCTRQNCGNPLKAGLQIYHLGSTDCMSAFVFRSRTTTPVYYLSSAGHCGPVGESKQHPSGAGIGSAVFSASGPSAGVDAQLIGISVPNASNLMFNNGGSTRSITSRERIASAVIGEGVCSSRLSGQTCGSLTAKGVDTCCAMDQFAASGNDLMPGDSGSPVYYGFQAQGIASNANCFGSSDCYTPVQAVEIWRSFDTLTSMP